MASCSLAIVHSDKLAGMSRDDAVRQRLGQILRELRESRGMSQSELAAKADMQQSDLSAVETGKYWGPIPAWLRLCRVLGASYAEVVSATAKPGKKLAALDDDEWELLKIHQRLNAEGRRLLLEKARAALKLFGK